MHRAVVWAALLSLVALPAGAAPERRCGWLDNPTPGNYWLRDRDGEWVLSSQGTPPPPGMEDAMPDLSAGEWVAVRRGSSYGHGCACVTLEADAGRMATRVLRVEQLPLARCRADRSLPRRS